MNSTVKQFFVIYAMTTTRYRYFSFLYISSNKSYSNSQGIYFNM